MAKTNKLVDAFKKAPNGLELRDILSLGFNEHNFYSRKSEINKNARKWKGIQIIRKGPQGQSTWKLAEREPQATIAYSGSRARRGVVNFLCMRNEQMIAIASEKNEKVKMQLLEKAQEINLNVTKLMQIM